METIKTKDYISQERMKAIKQIQENGDILKVRLYNQNKGQLEIYELEAKAEQIEKFKRSEIQKQSNCAVYIYKSNKCPDPLFETENGAKDISSSILYDEPDYYSPGPGISAFSYISSIDEQISNMMLEEYCKTPFPFMGYMHFVSNSNHWYEKYAEFCPMLLEHSNIAKAPLWGNQDEHIVWGPLVRYDGYDDYFASIRLGRDEEGADKHAWMIKSLTPMLYNLEKFMNKNFQDIDEEDIKTILELYKFNGLVNSINIDNLEKLSNYGVVNVKKPIEKKVCDSQKVLTMLKQK